jgi:DivIVA domain-containing protein
VTSSDHAYRRKPLSPHEIRSTRIRQIGFRKGYDPGEVEALLQRIAEETAARDGQIHTLLLAKDRLEREVYARRHGQLPHSPPEYLDEALIGQRVEAQRYADEVVAAAQANAAHLVQQSRQQANQIMRAAHEAAEQAVRDYRATAGASYSADREELTRLATLAQWAIRQFAGLRAQVDATDDAARQELSSILDRLTPILTTDSNPPNGNSSMRRAPDASRR